MNFSFNFLVALKACKYNFALCIDFGFDNSPLAKHVTRFVNGPTLFSEAVVEHTHQKHCGLVQNIHRDFTLQLNSLCPR